MTPWSFTTPEDADGRLLNVGDPVEATALFEDAGPIRGLVVSLPRANKVEIRITEAPDPTEIGRVIRCAAFLWRRLSET